MQQQRHCQQSPCGSAARLDHGQDAFFLFRTHNRPVADLVDVSQAADAETRAIVELADTDAGRGDGAVYAAQTRLFPPRAAGHAICVLFFVQAFETFALRIIPKSAHFD